MPTPRRALTWIHLMTASTPSESDCPVCGPALATFLQGHPQLGPAWSALPRKALDKGQDAPSGGLCFVEQGLLRSYWVDASGQQRNRAFHLPGDWAGSVAASHSLVTEALEPSRIAFLSWAGLAEWQAHGSVAAALVQALRVHIGQLAEREASQSLETATQRYTRLLQEQPDWLARVPQHHVASFLGITPVALSRIRRRLR